MNCKYHKEAEAKFICDKCKQPICEDCAVDIKGNKICSTCIQDSLQPKRVEARRGGFLESVFFFCCASIPGAAHMYMSLFKRGLQLMVTFIAAIVLFSYVNIEGFIPLVVFPTWFFSFFDSYAIRRKLHRGEAVEDIQVYDYNIFFKNNKYLGIVMVLLGLLGIMNAIGHSGLARTLGLDELYWAIKRTAVPIILVSTGVYILTKSRSVKIEPEQSDNNVEA